MEFLALLKLANTGIMLWETVGRLIMDAIERGDENVTMAEVEAAQAQAGQSIEGLRAAIAAA
jgi:hypothetical protein